MDSYDTGKTVVAAAGSTAVKRKVAWSSYAARFRELGLLFFIVLLCMIIQLRNPSFLTWDNIQDLVNNTAILSILSVGMMMVIITRGIDLSVGAILALSGMISAMTVSEYPGTASDVGIVAGDRYRHRVRVHYRFSCFQDGSPSDHCDAGDDERLSGY